MTLATKKLHIAAQIAHLDANDILDEYLDTFKFPSEESRKLSKVALLNYTAAAILMPYKLFSTVLAIHTYFSPSGIFDTAA